MATVEESRTIERPADTRTETITRCVRLKGLSPIMFDRYAGDNKTQLSWEEKIYLVGSTLVLPTINIVSFLSSHNTNSAPKRLRDARTFKKTANACLSFVQILGPAETPDDIPFLRDGQPIQVGKFNATCDPLSGLKLHRAIARLDKGIPNPKERPLLPLPWEIEFYLRIYPNKEIKEQEIRNLFHDGGLAIGLGTFRGAYGKFEIVKWQ